MVGVIGFENLNGKSIGIDVVVPELFAPRPIASFSVEGKIAIDIARRVVDVITAFDRSVDRLKFIGELGKFIILKNGGGTFAAGLFCDAGRLADDGSSRNDIDQTIIDSRHRVSISAVEQTLAVVIGRDGNVLDIGAFLIENFLHDAPILVGI